MDDVTKSQKGSPTRDNFKHRHKQLCKQFYACDLDFVFVAKVPMPDIIAAIDYKASGDKITFSEVIAYNALIRRGIPVYVVAGDVETGAFRIWRYKGGHHGKPRYDVEPVANTSSWDEFETWERALRDEYQKSFGQ